MLKTTFEGLIQKCLAVATDPVSQSYRELFFPSLLKAEKTFSFFYWQQTRRKLDDANKRLEALYDKLREQTVGVQVLVSASVNNVLLVHQCCSSPLQLSPAIVGGLHNIARSIETRCYTEGLNMHTHIVSNSNFSETSAFMPVLKVVLTQANKLGVWVILRANQILKALIGAKSFVGAETGSKPFHTKPHQTQW